MNQPICHIGRNVNGNVCWWDSRKICLFCAMYVWSFDRRETNKASISSRKSLLTSFILTIGYSAHSAVPLLWVKSGVKTTEATGWDNTAHRGDKSHGILWYVLSRINTSCSQAQRLTFPTIHTPIHTTVHIKTVMLLFITHYWRGLQIWKVGNIFFPEFLDIKLSDISRMKQALSHQRRLSMHKNCQTTKLHYYRKGWLWYNATWFLYTLCIDVMLCGD